MAKSKQYTYVRIWIWFIWIGLELGWGLRIAGRPYTRSRNRVLVRVDFLVHQATSGQKNYEMLSRKRKVARATHTTHSPLSSLHSPLSTLHSNRLQTYQKSRCFPPVQMLNCRHLVCNCAGCILIALTTLKKREALQHWKKSVAKYELRHTICEICTRLFWKGFSWPDQT